MPTDAAPGATDTEIDASTRKSLAGIAAVHHAVALLKALPSNGKAIGVNEVARRIGLHKSTVSRLIATLGQHDFVERSAEGNGVTLGMGLVAMVSPLLGKLDVARLAKPFLDLVARETGETCILALWSGTEAVMAEQTLGSRAVVHYAWPGKCVPAHTTAAGKVFIAYLPTALERILSRGLTGPTAYSITDPQKLRDELAEVRRCGYAVNDQENELESCGVAAIVRNLRGEPCAALTVAVPKHRFEPEQRETFAVVVMKAAQELSRRLGCGSIRIDEPRDPVIREL